MTEETKAPEAEAETTEAAPGLSLNDLVSVSRIIDLAVKRGAFNANEAAQVGAVWNRVAAFLETVAPAKASGEEEEAPAAEAAEGEA
jgi:hypothetical protein